MAVSMAIAVSATKWAEINHRKYISYLPHFTKYSPFCLPNIKWHNVSCKFSPRVLRPQNSFVYMTGNFDSSLLLGEKVSTTCLLQNTANLTHQITQRQLYMSRYSQTISLRVRNSMSNNKHHILLGERWHICDAGPSRDFERNRGLSAH